jgi:hypothetical protein
MRNVLCSRFASCPLSRRVELNLLPLLQAVCGLLYSQDVFAFLKEALNMRNAYAIYRTLAKFVEEADAAQDGRDTAIDEDFRSGVLLGNGLISLSTLAPACRRHVHIAYRSPSSVLSLLPSTVIKLMDVFGFNGDRDLGLSMLMRAGGWKDGVKEPSVEPEHEGLRRSGSSASLFHLALTAD